MENIFKKLGDITKPENRGLAQDIATGLSNEAVLLEAMQHIWEVCVAGDEGDLQHIKNVAELALQAITIPRKMQVKPFEVPKSKDRFDGMDWSDVQELRGE